MDNQRFDRLAKSLSITLRNTSRRSVMGVAFAGVIGALVMTAPGPANANRHARKRRKRKKRHATSECEDYMLRLGCSWAMGGGGFRWDCPAELRAGEWRMSACDGKNGITSLQGADMPAAYFAGADFQNVNLKYANLEYRSCGFLGNEWCLSNLNSTNCTGAQFDHAVLRGVSFRGANLKRTTFLGANLNCADFTGAFNVSEDTFRGISGDTHCFTPPDGKPGDDCAHIIRTQCPKA